MKTPSEMNGVELREAVAIEVMGWRLARLIPGGLWWFDGKRPVASVDDPEHDGPPAYESSIEAAFALVEKMREKGYHNFDMRQHFDSREHVFFACFWKLAQNKPDALFDKVPALAICRAALQAVRAAK